MLKLGMPSARLVAVARVWVAFLAFTVAATVAEPIRVPGTSNPWLAGMPPGTTASRYDVAPDQSPIEVRNVPILPGAVLLFKASGAVRKGPTWPDSGPDGHPNEIAGTILGSENGISDVVAPKNALLGVFLSAELPYLTPAPGRLSFGQAASRDYLTNSPGLKQVFFIGDGVTRSGAAQRVIVPADATRLFLGTMDGVGWFNNEGFFSVEIVAETPVQGTIINHDRENLAPTIVISNPEDRAVLSSGNNLQITAAAIDADGAISRVEFFAGSRSLGFVTGSPFVWTLRRAPVGEYALSAVATDDQGLSATSPLVRIAVREFSGDVAVVRSAPGPEIDKLLEYLSELGLSAYVFEPKEISFEALAKFQLVIWEESGGPEPSLTDARVAVLTRILASDIPLYFIGERLASSAASLSETGREQWKRLVQLQPADGKVSAGPVTIIETDTMNPIAKGRFGVVESFALSASFEAVSLVAADAQAFGLGGGFPVLVGHPGLDEADAVRSFTQNFLVHPGGDAASQHERKILFQNIVCWLIRCSSCNAVDVSLRVVGTEAPVRVGDRITYALIVGHSGECEAAGVSVTHDVPSGVRLISARPDQGTWRQEGNQVMFQMGRLAKSSVVEIGLEGVALFPGTMTNTARVRLNGPEVTSENNAAQWLTVVEGQPRPMLAIEPAGTGSFRVSVAGGLDRDWRIEVSDDLRRWMLLTNLLRTTTTMEFIEPMAPGSNQRFFRASPIDALNPR